MNRPILFHVFTFITTFYWSIAVAQVISPAAKVGDDFSTKEVLGYSTNGIQPDILFQRNGLGWRIDIELIARTNFAGNSWLKITNSTGSALTLWSTNGNAQESITPSTLSDMRIPAETTVSRIINSVRPAHVRGLQWWPVVSHPVKTGESYPSAGFELQSVFRFSPANDYVLQIIPLIYRVEGNGEIAHLVTFPPIKVRLMADGSVQKF